MVADLIYDLYMGLTSRLFAWIVITLAAVFSPRHPPCQQESKDSSK